MRSVLLAALLCAVSSRAAAQPARPEGVLILEPPEQIRSYDPVAATRRIEEIERALPHLRAPFARAHARLDRAMLRGAQVRSERLALLAWLIEQDEERTRMPPAEWARRRAVNEAEDARLRARAERTRAASIDELTELVEDQALRAWPELDEALNLLGYELASAKREDEAAMAYRRILELPGSRHRAVALVAVAEQAFERGELAAAEPLYREAQAMRDAPAQLRAYALYKRGWVQMGSDGPRDAFASFAAVKALAGDDPRAAMIAGEARRDLVRAFTGYGEAADAFAAFEAAAPGHGIELLDALAALWLESVRPTDAIAAYAELQRRAPTDPRRCTWQLGAARATRLTGGEPSTEELDALGVSALETRGAASECAGEARELIEEVANLQLREARRMRSGWSKLAERAEWLFGVLVRGSDPEAVAEARLKRAEAAALRARAVTGPPAAALWRHAAARFDEALQSPGLSASDRQEASQRRARARETARALAQ